MNKYTVRKSGIDNNFIEVNSYPLIGLRSFANEGLAKEIASALNNAYQKGRLDEESALQEVLEIGASKLEKLNKVAELAKTYMQSAGDRDSDKQFRALKDALDDLEEKKTFYVEVREVWVNTREVVAKNAEEAKRIAACGGGTDLPSVDLEYSHTLPSDGWAVEEKKKHY